jgi:hypothetical protein
MTEREAMLRVTALVEKMNREKQQPQDEEERIGQGRRQAFFEQRRKPLKKPNR